MKQKIDLTTLTDYIEYNDQFPSEENEYIISLGDYAIAELTPDMLVASSKIFFPDFIEYEGGIFLANKIKLPKPDTWVRWFKNNILEGEKFVNHVHLREDWQLIGFVEKTNSIAKLSNQNLHYLGEVLTHTWCAAAKSQFPERQIIVNGEWDDTSEDYIITVFQDPNI